MVQSNDLHLLTGSYALDALPEDEQAEFENHLAQCPSCAEEVRGLRETAARLALAAAATPPPEMRARVLAAAPLTRQLPPLGRNQPAQAETRTGWRRLTPVRASVTTGILALAAAVAFLLVTTISTNQQLHQAQASNRAIATVLSAPDARFDTVPATVGGTVTAVMSVAEHEAVVTAAHVPSLSDSRVYQLWVLNAAGIAKSAGFITVSGSGSATPVLADGVVKGDKLGVTVEPAGGTAQPTTTPVVLMSVTT